MPGLHLALVAHRDLAAKSPPTSSLTSFTAVRHRLWLDRPHAPSNHHRHQRSSATEVGAHPAPSSRCRWRRPFSTPAQRACRHRCGAGQPPPSSNASRRRPAGPMNADPRQDVQTVFHPRNFRHRSTASKSGCTTAVLGADPTVCCRVLHRIFLTLRLSCGARAPQRLRHRPPARRLLQPVVRPSPP